MKKGRYIPEPLNKPDNFSEPSTSGTKDTPQEVDRSAKEDIPSMPTARSETSSDTPSTSSGQTESSSDIPSAPSAQRKTPEVQKEPAKVTSKAKANVHHQPKQMRDKKIERNLRYRKNLSERKQFWHSQNAYYSHKDKNLKYENNLVRKHDNSTNRKPRFGSQENSNRKQRFGSEKDFNRNQRLDSKNNSNRTQRFSSEVRREQDSKVKPTNDQKQKGHLESSARKTPPSKSKSSLPNSSCSSPSCSNTNSMGSQKPRPSAEQK